MKMTTKGRCAVTAMVDLALREHRGPIPLIGVSERQHISLSYLEQLFGRLRRHGLVEATRGPGGGYTLARRAAEISVADIIEAADALQGGAGRPVSCLAPMPDPSGRCNTDDLWINLDHKMFEYLDSITLQHLAEAQRGQGVSVDMRAPLKRGFSTQPALQPVRTTAPNSVFAMGDAAQSQHGAAQAGGRAAMPSNPRTTPPW